MREADVLHPPLEPPAACPRCLRPLEPDKRQWGTCYSCGQEHPPTLPRIAAATYGATGTRPWIFFTTTKFEEASAEQLSSFVNGIAAVVSLTIETEHPEFVDGDDDHVVVPVPSSSGLIERCLAAIEANGCFPQSAARLCSSLDGSARSRPRPAVDTVRLRSPQGPAQGARPAQR